MIRAEMRLARQTDPCPERSEVIPEGPFLQLERDVVVGRTMGRKITSGIKRHPRGPANRSLAIGSREIHPPFRQGINVGSRNRRMTIAAQVICTQLVAHDKKDILDHISQRQRFFLQVIPNPQKEQKSNFKSARRFRVSEPLSPINVLAIENNACHLSGELRFR